MRTRPRRRLLASVLLLAFAAPWAGALLVAGHLAGHHPASAPGTALAVALHGHHHEPGTPDHDHKLLVPASVNAATQRLATVLVGGPSLGGWLLETASRLSTQLPAEQGVGPPDLGRTTTAILRI